MAADDRTDAKSESKGEIEMTKSNRQDSQRPRLRGRGRDDEPGYISDSGTFHESNNLSSLAATAIAHERRGNKPLTLAHRDPESGAITIEDDANGGGL
jgi:hypothetical protein